MPATPVWNALFVAVVSSPSAEGCTSLFLQTWSSRNCAEDTACGVFRVAVNLPPPGLRKSPPAEYRNEDQNHEV